MSRIYRIEQAIKRMDPSSFQRMCDDILRNKVTGNIYCLGSQAGNANTTKGTPDTYICTEDGKYVYAEYTKQEDFKKIKSDIEKCFDEKKTGIATTKISKLYHYNTSSNLSPSQLEELNSMEEEYNVEIEIIGINQIAYELRDNYKGIAKEYLNIAYDTEQIFTIDEFITKKNLYPLSNLLDIEFVEVEEEISQLMDIINNKNIVVVTGNPGVGKTRTCLEVCKKILKNGDVDEVICIRNNNLPLFEELNEKIISNKKYLIFVDDANVFLNLEHILDWSKKGNCKIVMTVRNYAYSQLLSKAKTYGDIKRYLICEKIETTLIEIIEKMRVICDKSILRHIIKLSSGNPRIALMATSILKNKGGLLGIVNVEEIYSNYLGQLIENIESVNEETLKVAGVIAFYGGINIEKTGNQNLDLIGLEKKEIKKCCLKLFEMEVLDKYGESCFKIQDESIQNYLMYYVFYKKRLIEFEELMDRNIQNQSYKIVDMVNVMFNIFYSEDLEKWIGDSICTLWDKYKQIDSVKFEKLFQNFAIFREVDALLILKDRIEQIEKDEYKLRIEDYNKNDNCLKKDIEIKILLELLNGKCRDTILELVCEKMSREPRKFNEVINALTWEFPMFEIKTNNLLEKMFKIIISMSLTDENFVIVFIKLAEYYLGFEYERKMIDKKKLRIIKTKLYYDEELVNYRNVIWLKLIDIMATHKSYVRKVLKSYNAYDNDVEIIKKIDLQYIKRIISLFDEKDFLDVLSVDQIVIILDEHGIEINEAKFFFDSDRYKLFKLMVPNNYEKDNEKNNRMIEMIKFVEYRYLNEKYNILQDIKTIKENQTNNIKGKIDECIENIMLKSNLSNEHYFEMIKYCLYNNILEDIHPSKCIELWLKKYNYKKIEELIDSSCYMNKGNWLFFLYQKIKKENATKEMIKKIQKYFSQKYEEETSWYKDIGFLEVFMEIEPQVFTIMSKEILKYKYEKFYLYFELLFKEYQRHPKDVIAKFLGNTKILREIYFELESYCKSFDYENKFLEEFIFADTNFLRNYVDIWIERNDIGRERATNSLTFIWGCDKQMELLKYIEENYIAMSIIDEWKLKIVFELVLYIHYRDNNKEVIQKKWIIELVDKYSHHENVMKALFRVISKYMNEEYFIEIIEKFLGLNNNYELFQQLSLENGIQSWSGSQVPLCIKQIEYFEKISEKINGIGLIAHKSVIQNYIQYWKKRKQNAEENEFFEED